MGNTLNNKKANGLALLPFLVFIVIYMGAGLVYQSKGVDMAFYQFPSVTAMFLAVLVAFIMFKSLSRSFHGQFHLLRCSGSAGSQHGSRFWTRCTACSAQPQKRRLPPA